MLRTSGAYTLILLAWAMFASCGVGHNQILFVTKTNASIEIDNSPPTAVFGIGRIEGEFSPQFEGGQKIPTLASFKFENQDMLAPHLGSAFAVGDAAMAMANLYDDPTPNGGYKAREKLLKAPSFDSTLELTQAPKSEIPGLDFPGPGEVSPVFFGTETSFGLMLGWSGLTAQYPDTARLGYVRKELALVPISYQETYKENGKNHEVRAASLLATVDSNVKSKPTCGKEGAKASQCVDLDYLQYFATGKAATLMAMQKDVRMAMKARLDPNLEKIVTLGGALPSERKAIVPSMIWAIYATLKELKDEPANDSIAKEHLTRLNKAAERFGVPKCYGQEEERLQSIFYDSVDNDQGWKTLTVLDDHNVLCNQLGEFTPNFDQALTYWKRVMQSKQNAESALRDLADEQKRTLIKLFKNGSNAENLISSPDWTDVVVNLADQVKKHSDRLHQLDVVIGANRDVIAAYNYVISALEGR